MAYAIRAYNKFKENFRAYGILISSKCGLVGPAVNMKRRYDLKESCWSTVLQIKSKKALCNSVFCFFFFFLLVFYCCLALPNTINVPCQFYILKF